MTAQRERMRRRLRRYAWILSLAIAAALSVVLAASIAAASPIHAPEASATGSLAGARRPIARWALQSAALTPTDDITSTLEDQAMIIDVLANDGDAGTLTVTGVGAPAHGEAATGGSTVTYTPTLNYNGTDTFTYTACYVVTPTECAGAVVTVTVEPENDPPEAGDHTATTAEDTQIAISLADLVTDVETLDPGLAYLIVAGPDHGGLTAPSTVVTYTPNGDWSGIDVFSYTVTDRGDPDGCGEPGPGCDGILTSTARAVTVTVTPDNDAPVAAGDVYSTAEDTVLTIDAPGVLGNDTDAENDPLTATLASSPISGSLVLNGDGSFTYTPGDDLNGVDGFTYRAGDGGLESNEASVAITITSVNDAPSFTVGSDQTVEEDAGSQSVPSWATDISAGPPDEAWQTLVFEVTDDSPGLFTTPPAISTEGTLTYEPAPDGYGTATVSVSLHDGGGTANGGVDTSLGQTFAITVTAVNDAPVAVGDDVATEEDTPLVIDVLANDTDPEDDSLTVTQVTDPAHGDAATDGISVTYTPAANYAGADGFYYTVSDSGGLTATARVTVTVSGTNDPPLAAGNTVTTTEDVSVTVDVLANDTDPDGDTLSVTQAGGAAHGTVITSSAAVTYTPAANYNGGDAFTYTVSDGQGGVASAPVTVTIYPVNDVPVAADSVETTDEDTPLTIDLGALVSDVESIPGEMAYAIVSSPAHGSLTGSLRTRTYMPAQDYFGSDSFSYNVTDRGDPNNCGLPDITCAQVETSQPATVTITIAPVNDAPVAVGDEVTTSEDVTATVSVLQNDTDADEDPLTVIQVAAPAHGLAVTDGQVVTYTPHLNYYGGDLFGYTISDGHDGIASAPVTVTVTPVNDPPELPTLDDHIVDEESELTFTVVASDGDLPTDTLTYSLAGTSPEGAGINPTTGAFSWTPTETQGPGTYTLTVRVTDAAALYDEEDLCVTVSEANLAPILDPIGNQTVDEWATLAFTATATDTDVPSNTLTFSLTGSPPDGASIGAADGAFSWAPSEAQGPGVYTFTVRVTDDGVPSLSDQQPVTVTVEEVNTAPTLSPIGDHAVPEGELLSFTATATDPDLPPNTLTFGLTGQPAGAGIDPVSGDFGWTPAEDQGPNSYTFGVHVGDGVVTTSETITVTVSEVNDAPTLDPIGDQTVDEWATLTFTATATDTDVPSNTLTFSLTGSPPDGASIGPSTGVFGWTPVEADGPGDYPFGVQVSDGLLTGSETISVHVTPVNEPPAATDGSASTDEDTAVTIDLGAWAGDAETAVDDLTYHIGSGPAHGALVGSGQLKVYTPTADYYGPDSFTYYLTDRGDPDGCSGPSGECASVESSVTATVSITIDPVNDPPVALDDTYEIDEDLDLVVGAPGVLGNDSDAGDDDVLMAALVGSPAHGTVTLDPDGSFAYSPDPDYSGTDSFTYRAQDGVFVSNPATVTINVRTVNDPPVATADSYATGEDEVLVVAEFEGVLANDDDVENAVLTATLVADVVNGGLALHADGSFVYTPTTNYNGADRFTYQASDGLAHSGVVTVTLAVAPVNDAPVGHNDDYSTDEDVVLSVDAPGVLGNDTDVDGDVLTATLVAGVLNGDLALDGDGSFVYTPTLEYNGADVFTYRATDGLTTSNLATVTITVGVVNDPPVAANDSYTTTEDGTLTVSDPTEGVLDNDVDAEEYPLTAGLVGLPTHGTVILEVDGTFVYTPTANYNGGDAFTYQARDDAAGSNLATVGITVAPVNDDPVALDDTHSTNEDVALSVSAPGVLGNDTDIDGDALTATLVSMPMTGTLDLEANGSFVFTPADNYGGMVSFVYRASDGHGGADVATVTITVNSVNDAPVAVGDVVTATEDTSCLIDVLANDYDVEDDPLDFYVGSAAHGTAVKSDEEKTVTYTPSSNYYGLDGFTYILSDGHGGTASGVVSITVEALNDPPVTAGDIVTTTEDTPVTVDVLANDVPGPANESTQALTVTAVTAPAHGSALVNPDGTVTYSPGQDYYGPDSLICTVCDDGDPSECASGTVDVTVTAVNDAPVATADAYAIDEDQVLAVAALGVLGNDTDVDGPSLAAVLVDDVEHGDLDLSVDGSFVYTPTGDYNGSDGFTYRASDGELQSALTTVTITVNPVNDPPVALDDAAYAVAGNPVTVDVLDNDSDADGDQLTIIAVGTPSQGAASIVGAAVVYTPGSAFSGDEFTYTVSDGHGGQASATVTVSVGNPCYLPLVLRPVTCGSYEPNNAIGTAWGPLESGRTYRAMLCDGDIDDLYKFVLDAPHRIVADLTDIPAGANYDLSLWRLVDGDPTWVAGSAKPGNADERIDFYDASLTGTLYVRVYPKSGYSNTQAYSLKVTYK